MKINSIVKDPEQLFKVQFNDEVALTLRYVSREQLDRMLRQATITSFNRSSHQKESDFDHLLYGELLGRAAIVDWSGLEVDDQPYPCTPDNAALLMRRWTGFAKFVSDMCSDLECLIDGEKEQIRKNSVTTSGAAQTIPM